MKEYIKDNTKLYNMDCLEGMKKLDDKSQHLIIVDPPYFEVKGDFDFTWGSFEDYLKDVEKWAIECKRVLADNGTLFWWGNTKKIAYTQIILDKYFSLENSMVWRKIDSMQYQYYSVDLSRSFNTHTERVLMYSNERDSLECNKTGLEQIIDEYIKPNHPFAIYMRDEFKKAEVSNKEIAKLFPSKTGGLTGCVSNWLNGDNTPTEEQYLKMRSFLNNEYLRKEYEELRKEYEELRKEYEEFRRFFNNTMKLEDVLEFSQQSSVTSKFSHPTQKPPILCKSIITTCSKKGQNMLVPFIGSGVEVSQGIQLGLNVTGFEIDSEYFKNSIDRIEQETAQLSLF
jgi:site-specific DNA-methyltransferase (adenine-specific)